ncbi:TonB-linked SusC/RagA family outer membrane protein [Parabacteroides sp. PF5-5]|uniref:TonB-dependent receptor n=1 Tax=unclassified Parabacteroides TaxID=2649774 RepID=UPI0024736181|nr:MULTISPECIES: TonB-dependent receptor [unclassified Parabacteroides]MDH6306256.1 TonB-linked SusC/RagA family outer membrane protein [Parabacteroides sp. PH5-39]MDH6316952.1 TonB-linked SusC/RagA family outer membrane protein [Parabacteroides sp. PF5-13]MDH6321022.1 TonB-linked SusC/RagA family outer membrane protein [Parabacteroides sp. PH5-13]MDH6324754.1 TonB-linked SusC/RagA family outer membrane protein [Parabacteroides sp. PH5-8]MDH6328137.1 TonB-linked SusC/RagA family outer membrane
MKENMGAGIYTPWHRKFMAIMRNIFILLIFFASNLLASSGYSQNTRFDISLSNISLERIFNEIEKKSEFSIIYKSNEVDLKERVSVEAHHQPVEKILDNVLKNQELQYVINDKHIIIFKAEANKRVVAPTISQQTGKKITGTVTDNTGESIIGASILEKGTQNGIITDMNGNYTLQLQGNNAVLVVSYIGYMTKEVTVGNLNVVNIELGEDVQQLDDVVIVGYAVGNKRSVSGAVEKIKKEDMNSGVVTQPLEGLKGKIAGVIISNVGGDPTGDMNIRIRGTTSLSGGNDPLVIIDGVFGDLSMLNAISPSDIESLTILKDASETAQYGSRGASGVIVVTTQRGKSGFSQIEYSGLFGVNAVYKNLDMLTADEWRAGVSKLGLNGNDQGASTNWAEEIQRGTTLVQTHNLSLTNGSENGNFRASLGVVDRPGLLRNSGSRNYTAKIDGSQFAFDKKLRLDMGAFASRRERDEQYDIYRTFYSAASYNPTYPNYKNPETGVWDEDQTALEVYNPLGMLDIDNKRIMTHVNVNGRFNLEIISGLNLTGFGSYTYFSNNQKLYIPNDIQQGSMLGNGRAQVHYRERNDLMGNLQLNYSKSFGKHDINALALLEAQKQTYFESRTRVTGFETNFFKYNNLEAGANISWGNATSNATRYSLLSYMARLNYMYDGKYVVTANVRRDGSSKLGSGNKWGIFPSASAAWIASNEGFLKDIKAISNLKLRVGYGVTGNQDAIDPYESLSLMDPNGTTLVDGSATTTFAIASNANPDLRWEKKYTFDVGLDLAMFDSRLRFTADYYASRTKDMLYEYTVPVPPFVYSTMLANLGEMSNNGFEFAISGDVIRKKDFGLTVGLNMSFQKNKLESLSGTYMGSEFTTSQYIQLAMVNASGLTQYSYVTYLTEGQPIGVFFVPKCNGLMDVNGKNVYDIVDLNEDGKVDLSNNGGDRYIAGQAIPKAYLGASINLRYKDFELSTQLNGAFGHKIYNGTSLTFNNLSLFPTYNVLDGALEKNIYDIKISDYYLEKGDYVHIEYVTLAYNIPKKVFNTKYLKELRLAFSVNNLATITSYSGLTPLINSMNSGSESSISRTIGLDDKLIYPLSRTYSLSVGVKF